MRARCTRVGLGANGRTSWMRTFEEEEGESRKEPLGERDREVGVSVCPVRE